RHTRFVPLTSRGVALENLNFAARIEPNGCCTVTGLIFHRNENGRRDARELGPNAESDADVAAALPNLALLSTELRQVDRLDKVIPDLEEVAAVIVDTGRRYMRETGN